MASDSQREVADLGSFAFGMDSAKQMFDDEDLQMLVYTGAGQGLDGDVVNAPGAPANANFLGWSASLPKADGPESNAQPIPPPLTACDSFVPGSDNQSLRSSAPSVFERNSSGRLSHQQHSNQLPVLQSTHSNDLESFPLFDREGSNDGSHGSAGGKKRGRNNEEKKKRFPGTMRGPFHPSGPCLLTNMTEELKALENVLAMSSFPLEIAEEAAEQVYVPKRGKGGRNPALDARLDPNIDPKKAARIMANRLSAARSKMRRKMISQTEGLQSKLVLLELQKHRLEREVERLDKMCKAMEVEVYGRGTSHCDSHNRIRESEGGVLKGSAGIAFEIDFQNPMAAIPMNLGLPPPAPPANRHQHSQSWSQMNSAFNNGVGDAFNNQRNAEGWQPHGGGGFSGNMLHLGVNPEHASLQATNSMPQVYFGL